MASNLFRFTRIGEALEDSLQEVQDKNNLPDTVCERIREKFDQVANQVSLTEQVICKEVLCPAAVKHMTPAIIVGKEHEFKFNEGSPGVTRGLALGPQGHPHGDRQD